jgi:hypothetical protein
LKNVQDVEALIGTDGLTTHLMASMDIDAKIVVRNGAIKIYYRRTPNV